MYILRRVARTVKTLAVLVHVTSIHPLYLLFDYYRAIEELSTMVSSVMDSYNVLIHGWSSKRKSCLLIQICFECCNGGRTCTNKFDLENPAAQMMLYDPSSTSFNGNTNRRVIQTAACFNFKTIFSSGKLDGKGNMMFEGMEVDVLDIIARVMNFTYVYQRPEPTSTFGIQLPNGSWTALIGDDSFHTIGY